MKIAIALLSATAAITLPAYVFAADQSATIDSSSQYKDNGGYSTSATAKSTDANGTETTAKQSEDVDVDNNGDKTTHVKKVTTVDPKGSNNEKKTVSDVTTQQKANGNYSKSVTNKNLNGGGTDVTTKSNTDVKVDPQGNVTKTTDTEKTVDPKTGLFSAQTTSTKTKTVNGQVVDEQKQAPAPDNSAQ
jgi:hypothetical protein